MPRLSVHEIRATSVFSEAGICSSNLQGLLAALNNVVQRLMLAGGETGWYGTWSSMVFNLDPNNPFITAPREVARLINLDVCRYPIKIQNGFFEFLQFGHGYQKQFNTSGNCASNRCCAHMEAYDRGSTPVTVDLPSGSKIRVYWTNTGDDKRRVFIAGTDTNNLPITSVDNGSQVNGFFLSLDQLFPFTDSAYTLNKLNGIIKDITLGPVNVYAVDSVGNQTLLASLQPSERSPSYRRYFIAGMPNQCLDCDSVVNQVQIQAMARLDFVPMTNDVDFCLIGNLPALEEGLIAWRLRKVDSPTAKAEAKAHEKEAIRLLNQELVMYLGKEDPAVGFSPFGPAHLSHLNIGMM